MKKSPQHFTKGVLGLKAYKTGYFAEFIARMFLRVKGYKILAKNYKTGVGEIDIIAKKKNCIAFIEVKYRKTKNDALHAIPVKTQQRICKAAGHYISHNSVYTQGNDPNFTLRFDFIACAPPYYIKHIPNAWIL